MQENPVMTTLDVSDEGLTELFDLPDTLTKLYCRYNLLTELPFELKESKCKVYADNKKQLYQTNVSNRIKRYWKQQKTKKRTIIVANLHKNTYLSSDICYLIGAFI